MLHNAPPAPPLALPVPPSLTVADLAIAALLAALALASIALAVADIRRGMRLESFTGRPPGPALRYACVLTPLTSAVLWTLGIGSGMHARLAHAWLGSATPWEAAFLMALPVFVAVPAAWQSVRLDHRRRNGPAAKLPGVSPAERAARARLDGVSVLIGVVGFLGSLAMSMYHPVSGRLASAAIETLPAALAGAAIIAAQRGVSRWEKPTPAPDLLERARALSGGRVRILSARVDETLEARGRCRALLVRGSLTVSRRLVETFTPEEMDFALAKAACLAEAAALPAWANALLTLFLTAELAGSVWMLRLLLRGDVHAFLWMLGIIALIVLIGIPAVIIGQRRGDRRSAVLALKATGNLEAAESALRKMANDEEDCLADLDGGVETSIARLRNASREQGLAFMPKRPLNR